MTENIENPQQEMTLEVTDLEKTLLTEIKLEHQTSSFRNDDQSLLNYIREGMADINENNGADTDFENDLLSRRLLKLYVLYADNKRIAEFKCLYVGEYAERQRFYFQKSCTNL